MPKRATRLDERKKGACKVVAASTLRRRTRVSTTSNSWNIKRRMIRAAARESGAGEVVAGTLLGRIRMAFEGFVTARSNIDV